MWRILSGTEYFIKYLGNRDFKEIFITNFEVIYITRLSERELLQQAKGFNPQLAEIDDSELISNVEDILGSPTDKYKIDLSVTGDNNLIFTIMRPGTTCFPLRFKLTMSKGSENNFFTHVTAPLLNTVNDLKVCQENLCKLIVQKDKEINEYRMEGAKLFYEHIKRLDAAFRLPHFNYEEYKARDTSLTKLFKNNKDLEFALKKVIDDQVAIPVKKESNANDSKGNSKAIEASGSCDTLPPVPKVEQCSSKSETSVSNGGNNLIHSTRSTHEVSPTTVHDMGIVNEEMKYESKQPIKRELQDPQISNSEKGDMSEAQSDVPSFSQLKEEIIDNPSSRIRKKPRKLLNL